MTYSFSNTNLGIDLASIIFAVVEVDDNGSFHKLLGTAFLPNCVYPVVLTAAHLFKIYEEVNDHSNPLRNIAPQRVSPEMRPSELRLAQLTNANRRVINPISMITSTEEDVAMILYGPSMQSAGSRIVSKPKLNPSVGDPIFLVGCQYSSDEVRDPDLDRVEIKMIETTVSPDQETKARIGFGRTIKVASSFPPGFSGGPAFTQDGDFVGVCSNASNFIPDEGHIAVLGNFEKTMLNFGSRGEYILTHPQHGEISLNSTCVFDWLNDLRPRC